MEELMRIMIGLTPPVDQVTPDAPVEHENPQFGQVTDLGMLMMSPRLNPSSDMAQRKKLGREAFLLDDAPPETATDAQRMLHDTDRQMVEELLQILMQRYPNQETSM